MTVTFEVDALEEYQSAAIYSEQRFGLGEAFIQAVELSIKLISQDPERSQSLGNDIRIFQMQRFPYYLFYHHISGSDSISIYAVAHHSRKQGYWRSRLR